jgi:hypothetical protein
MLTNTLARLSYGAGQIGSEMHLSCRADFPLPTSPTKALPGSVEKIAVLAERARQKFSLWHPDDTCFFTRSFVREL